MKKYVIKKVETPDGKIETSVLKRDLWKMLRPRTEYPEDALVLVVFFPVLAISWVVCLIIPRLRYVNMYKTVLWHDDRRCKGGVEDWIEAELMKERKKKLEDKEGRYYKRRTTTTYKEY